MSRLTGVIGATLLATLALPGCSAPPAPEGPTSIVMHIPDREAFLDDTVSLLRRYDFPPDTFDRERGYIVTRPATTGQWFEFWRVDARGGYNFFEANIHTVRRTVKIALDPLPPYAPVTSHPSDTQPASDDGEYRVTVTVEKERLSAPERQVTTTSGALGIFDPRYPTEAGRRGVLIVGGHWVPLGRDPVFEAYLVERLRALQPEPETLQ